MLAHEMKAIEIDYLASISIISTSRPWEALGLIEERYEVVNTRRTMPQKRMMISSGSEGYATAWSAVSCGIANIASAVMAHSR